MLFLRALVGVVIAVCFFVSDSSFAIKYRKLTKEDDCSERDEGEGSRGHSPLSVSGSPSSMGSPDSGVQMDLERTPESDQQVLAPQRDMIASLPAELNVLICQILMGGDLTKLKMVYKLREVSTSWRDFVDSSIHLIVKPGLWRFGGKGYLGSDVLTSVMVKPWFYGSPGSINGIRQLEISTQDVWSTLGGLRSPMVNLETLVVRHTSFLPSHPPFFEAGKFPNLKELHLLGCSQVAELTFPAEFPIRTLRMEGGYPQMSLVLSKCGSFNIRHFDLHSNTEQENEGAAFFSDWKSSFPNILSMKLTGYFGPVPFDLGELPDSIEHLSLTSVKVKLGWPRSLKKLRLGANHLTSSHLQDWLDTLKDSGVDPLLSHVSMVENQLGGSGETMGKLIQRCQFLTHLDLESNGLQGTDVPPLVNALTWKPLCKKLILAANSLGKNAQSQLTDMAADRAKRGCPLALDLEFTN